MLWLTMMTVAPVFSPVGAEVLLYLPAAGRVEPRGRLIEHEHLRTHRDDARDGYAPLLPARELQRGALEQLLIDAGEARGLTHAAVDLLLGELHVRRAEGDVLIHRLLKELVLRILEHEPDLEPYRLAGELILIDILTAAEHRARSGLEQRVEVLYKRWTSGAGVTDHADQLPLRECVRSMPSIAAFSKGVPTLYTWHRRSVFISAIYQESPFSLMLQCRRDLAGAGVHLSASVSSSKPAFLRSCSRRVVSRHGQTLALHERGVGKDLLRRTVGNDAAV